MNARFVPILLAAVSLFGSSAALSARGFSTDTGDPVATDTFTGRRVKAGR